MKIKLEGGAINTDHARQFKAKTRKITHRKPDGENLVTTHYSPVLEVFVIWSDGVKETIHNEEALLLADALRSRNSANKDPLCVYFAEVREELNELDDSCNQDNEELEGERDRQYQENLNEQYESLKGIVRDYFESN